MSSSSMLVPSLMVFAVAVLFVYTQNQCIPSVRAGVRVFRPRMNSLALQRGEGIYALLACGHSPITNTISLLAFSHTQTPHTHARAHTHTTHAHSCVDLWCALCVHACVRDLSRCMCICLHLFRDRESTIEYLSMSHRSVIRVASRL